MANRIYAIGRSVVLLVLGVHLLEVAAFVNIFSPDTTLDFSKGGIDVVGIVKKDWAALPSIGSCYLSNKFGYQHKFNNASSGIKGTLHTTFEYLTGDCTAEYKRDPNMCATLIPAFSVCASFPLDARMTTHPWGYCSNFNFRVSYLWNPNEGFINTTDIGPINPLNPVQPLPSTVQTDATEFQLPERQQEIESVSTDAMLGAIDSTDQEALAVIHKDVALLKRVELGPRYAGLGYAGGRTDTGCNWKYSQIIPVAWDGIQNTLLSGQYIASMDSTYAFAMQDDCNLVLYKKGLDGKYEWNAMWASFSNYSDPFPRNCTLELQPSGNLVVRDPNWKPRWSSGKTAGSSLYSAVLAVLMNGNVVVYEMISGTIIWATNTNQTVQL